MTTINVNTSDYAIRQAREELAGFAGSLDAKRPAAWRQFGYRETLTFTDYLQAYERGGAGQGAVHRILDKCWECPPRIKQPAKDEETPWETKLTKLLTGVKGWQKLRDFDRRNMVGRYAGLIYRVADGLALREPMVRASRLVDLVPVYEDQLKVTQWDSDLNSENYGQPTMWQYRMRRPMGTDTQGAPDQWQDVHPSRVQILAEGSVGDFMDGVPLLKAGFNALVDLEKVSGGSAESFLKNSARAVTINFDANASPQVITQNPDGSAGTQTVREVLGEQVDSLNRSVDSALVTQGAEAGVLQTTVSDPEPSFNVAANMFAASVRIPMTILFGAQTGRLASDQDVKDMNARCESRRENELTPMLKELVRRLQAVGLVDAGDFEVEWEDLGAATDSEKFDLLAKATAAMKQAFDAGLGQPLFDANELRGIVDFEEQDATGMPQEDDPEADVGANPGPQPKPALRAAA